MSLLLAFGNNVAIIMNGYSRGLNVIIYIRHMLEQAAATRYFPSDLVDKPEPAENPAVVLTVVKYSIVYSDNTYNQAMVSSAFQFYALDEDRIKP